MWKAMKLICFPVHSGSWNYDLHKKGTNMSKKYTKLKIIHYNFKIISLLTKDIWNP